MLYIFDSTEKLIATLPEGSFFDAVHHEVLNGENTFEFSIPAGSEYIVEGNLVAFRDLDSYWQVFEIKRLVDLHGDGLTRTAYCEHIFYELLDDIVTDKRPSADATAALTGMLDGTRWQVGIVDDLGAASTNAYYESALSGVQKVAEAWRGELNWRCVIAGGIITRYVDLLAMVGTDTGKQFVYSKDILSIEREVDSSGVVTALYGRGKGIELDTGSYGRRLTFADIEASGKPLGQEWIGDADALAQWGRGGRHRFDVFTDEEETDPAALLQKTRDELARRKAPRVTYRLDVVSLEELSGYEHEKARKGDLVRVIDREFEPELVVSARVIELERDLLAPENTKVVLGSFAPSIVDATINTQRRVNDMANRPYNTKWLDGKIDVLQNAIENTQSYVFQTADDGILILDAADYATATKAMKLGGGIFAIANQKDGNGGWNWRTFGDGSGFTADLITAGILDAGLVQIGSATTFEPGYDPSKIVAGSDPMLIDSSCKALFHFDRNLNSHNRMLPVFERDSIAYTSDGKQVGANEARFEQGVFGQGVLIEEGTTNLLPANQSSVETDLTGFTSNLVTLARDSSHALYGNYALKCVWNNVAGDAHIIVGPFNLQPNVTYTWSAYVYAESDVCIPGSCFLQEASTPWRSIAGLNKTVLVPAGTWTRIAGAGHTHADWLGSSRLVLRPPVNTSGSHITTPIWVDGVQVEQKPYATSFVNGTRANEVLKLPANLLNKGNWTVSLRYKTEQQENPVFYHVLWDCYLGAGDYYQIGFENGTRELLLIVVSDTAPYILRSGIILSAGTSYDIVATGDGSNLSLYVDGVKVGTTTPYVEPIGALPAYMHIGSTSHPSHQANGIIDELAIFDYAATDTEVAEWYDAGKPFYTVEDGLAFWPGYMRLETDGVKIYDASGELRVLQGSWLRDAVRKYGLKINEGEIYSSIVRSGAEDADTYIQFKPPNSLEVYYGGYLQMIIEAVEGGRITYYRNGTMIGRLSGYYSGADIGIIGISQGKIAVVGNLDVTGNLSCSGSKPAQQVTENYGLRYMYATEAPELVYYDRGVVSLVNGEATVKLDPIYLECIEPDCEFTPWQVWVQAYGENDVYVSEVGTDYFKIKERNGGTSNNKVVWKHEAIRNGYAGIRLMEVVD